MSISAKEAAESVGLTKHAIIKSIRDGRISAFKDKKGQWRIEPSELYRVYDTVNTVNSEPVNATTSQYTPKVNSDTQAEIIELRVQARHAEEKIQSLTTQLRRAEDRERDMSEKLDKAQNTIDKQTHLISDMRQKRPESSIEHQKRLFGIIPLSKTKKVITEA